MSNTEKPADKIHTLGADKSSTEGRDGGEGAFNAEEIRTAFDKTMENTQVFCADLALKSFTMLRDGAEVGLEEFKALAGARSFSDVVELQGTFLRKQMDFAVRQAKEFQTLSERAINEIARPMRDMFTAPFKHI